MPEPKMVDEERIVTEQVGGFLRVREWRYRVSLDMVVIRTQVFCTKRMELCTHQISDDENRILELLGGCEWGKSFDRADGPSW